MPKYGCRAGYLFRSLPLCGVGRCMAAPAKLLRSGPASRVVRGLLKRSDMVEVGAFVDGLDGLGVDVSLEPEPLLGCWTPSRVFESQQTEPFSQRLGGLLITTDGLEQKADIRPGRQTPGQRFNGAVVVVVVEAVGFLVVVVNGLTVVDDTAGRALGDGRGAVAVEFFCSAFPAFPALLLLPSRRLMQHLPPLEQTAFGSMKSHK